MNVNIELPSEIESQLCRSAAAAGTDVPTFVKQLLTERLSQEEKAGDRTLDDPNGFEERQNAWVKHFPVLDHAIDDSRESFYEGRE
jgi:hypothetical protein